MRPKRKRKKKRGDRKTRSDKSNKGRKSKTKKQKTKTKHSSSIAQEEFNGQNERRVKGYNGFIPAHSREKNLGLVPELSKMKGSCKISQILRNRATKN